MSKKYLNFKEEMIERMIKPKPSILYKYRSWGDSYHQKLITELQLYFADPITLNDAWDGGNPIRWDLLKYEDCLELNKHLIRNVDQMSVEQADNLAKQMIENKNGYYPDMRRQESLPVYSGNSEIGIVALSSQYDNPLLWAYYGDGHKGFTVGLDYKELNSYYGNILVEEIRYVDDYPEIRVGDFDEFRKRYCTKLKGWQHEMEWRLIANKLSLKKNFKNRVLTLSKSSIKEIIIGARASEKTKQDIINVVRQKLPQTIIKQTELTFQGVNKMNFKVI